MEITVIDHPLAAERLTILRSTSTTNAEFRQALDGLSGMLLYEATRHLAMEVVEVSTPLGPANGRRLGVAPMLVPILRAGVGMVSAALRLIPQAEVGFVGLARNEETFLPMPYLAKLPDRLDGREVFVLDPMLATGGSLAYTCELLIARRGARPDHRRVRARRAGGAGAGQGRGHRPAGGDGGGGQPPERAGLHRPGAGRRRRPPVRALVGTSNTASAAAQESSPR